MTDILAKLSGGDRRSIGRSNEVVADVLANPRLFDALFGGLTAADPLVRMRAADAVEKITTHRPELLQPHAAALLAVIAPMEQQEVRWHVAQMLPRLTLTTDARDQAVSILEGYLADRSRIVQTFALQALADLAAEDEGLQPRVVRLLETALATGSPALQSRARRLLEAHFRYAEGNPHYALGSTTDPPSTNARRTR